VKKCHKTAGRRRGWIIFDSHCIFWRSKWEIGSAKCYKQSCPRVHFFWPDLSRYRPNQPGKKIILWTRSDPTGPHSTSLDVGLKCCLNDNDSSLFRKHFLTHLQLPSQVNECSWNFCHMMKYTAVELINEWDALNTTTIPSMNKALIDTSSRSLNTESLRHKRLYLLSLFQTAEYHVTGSYTILNDPPICSARLLETCSSSSSSRPLIKE